MYKKYDHRRIPSHRSLKICDICRLFRDKKLHEQTVRGWVRSGKLKAIWDGKTILIYGAVLKQFLLDTNNSHRRILEFNQFRCFKCKQINSPLNNTITNLTNGRGGCILSFAMCPHCNHRMHRPYKKNQMQQILESFTVQYNEVMLISDSLCSTNNTHIKTTLETAISEPPKNKPPDKTPTPTNSTSKTNIKLKINSVSTSNTHINQQLRLF